MDRISRNQVIDGLKELSKHLENAQEQLNKLIPNCQREITRLENDEIVHPLSENPRVKDDCRKRKAAVEGPHDEEGESSKRRRKEYVMQPMRDATPSTSENEQESSDSEISREDKQSNRTGKSYYNKRERDDRSSPPKNKRCYLCRSESHFARNCCNVNRRCYECNKKGHIQKDCTIRERRFAYENQNDSY